MREIELTQNKVALVDDEDFARINQYKWYVVCTCNYWRAVRTIKKLNGKQIMQFMHRFIMNFPKGLLIDHKNHNTLDNRKSNLRICTCAENNMNKLPFKRKTTSKYKGVYWDRGRKKWRAHIRPNNKHLNLGRFINEISAAFAYDKAAKKYYGEFAYLNFGNR